MYEYLKDPIQRTQYTLNPDQPMCIYQIVTEFKRPFLLFLFCKSTGIGTDASVGTDASIGTDASVGTYSLPTVQSGMTKLKDIQQHLNLLDYPLKYKGLLHGTLMFHYRAQESFMNIFDTYSNLAATQWLLPWEIVNTRHCDGVPVARSATTFFLNNPELLFLRTADSTGQTIASPRIGYVLTSTIPDFKTDGVEYMDSDFLPGIAGYNFLLTLPADTAVRMALLDENDDAKNNCDPELQQICLSTYGYHAPLSLLLKVAQ